MKITKKEIAAGKAALAVEVDAETWKKAQEKAFKKLAEKVTVKGFRPGKAPEALLKERVNQAEVYEEAALSLLNPTFAEAVKESGLEPFMRPDAKINKLSGDELELEYDFVLPPTVELGEYKNLGIKPEEVKVAAEEVEAEIDRDLKGNADLVSVEREAKEGNTLVLDFKGYTKNAEGVEEAFEGGEASNYSLELGSHSFVPGFEEALVGTKAGEEKDIEITFPENYVKELAGKKARFHCVIHEVKERKIPEKNDEAVKSLGLKDIETLDALRAKKQGDIESRKKREAEDKYVNALLEKIAEKSTFTVAPEIYQSEAKARLDRFKKQIEDNGIAYEQYLQIVGQTEADLLNNFEKEGKKNIDNMLILAEIAKKEGIKAEEKDIEDEYESLSKRYGMDKDAVKKAFKGREEELVNNVTSRKLLEALKALNA